MENFLKSKQFLKLEKEFSETLLFDFVKNKFVRKNELSSEAREKYQEHTNAHIKHLKKRTKELLKSGVLKK